MFFLPPSLVQHHAQCCGCSYFFPPTISNQRLSFCYKMITTCHARLRLQVRDMFAQMASALAHSKVRRFPRLRLLLCFPILPHCICKQQVPQTSLILRRAELTVIEASTSAGPTVLHYIVKGSLPHFREGLSWLWPLHHRFVSKIVIMGNPLNWKGMVAFRFPRVP